MAVKSLYLKHLIATSTLASKVGALRAVVKKLKGRGAPELALLRAEERIMEKHITQIVRPGMLCLDIGAHIGSISYLLNKAAGPGQTRLIEAVPQKAAWLAQRFGKENVYAFAVAETPGTITFHVNDARPGFSSITETKGSRPIEVNCERLDSLFPEESFQFIKIDVEGHELPVLKSGQQLLARSSPTILFEAGPVAANQADPYDDLFSWLTTEMDYSVYAVFQKGHLNAQPLDLNAFRLFRTYPYIAFNFFAVPRKST